MLLVLGPPSSPPIKLVLADTGMIWSLVHIRVIAQDPQCIHHSVSIIELILMVIIHLVLQLVMVKVVWVLVPPTLPSRKLIVGLMVVILCHVLVGIIQL